MSWNRCKTHPLAAIRGTSGTPRHTRLTRYRCSLPGLAGFAGNRCTEPEVPPIGSPRAKISAHKTAPRSLAQRHIARKPSAPYAWWCSLKIRAVLEERKRASLCRIEGSTAGQNAARSAAGTSQRATAAPQAVRTDKLTGRTRDDKKVGSSVTGPGECEEVRHPGGSCETCSAERQVLCVLQAAISDRRAEPQQSGKLGAYGRSLREAPKKVEHRSVLRLLQHQQG